MVAESMDDGGLKIEDCDRPASSLVNHVGAAPRFINPHKSLKDGKATSNGEPRKSPYEKLVWQQEHDKDVRRDISLGRRIGFCQIKAELGHGNFSKVKLAKHLLTQEKVAIKIIDKSKLDSKTQKMVLREISIMDALKHPNLIRLYEVSETLSHLYLIMEHAPGGELFERISDVGRYDEAEAKPIFAQIASAIDYMHEHLLIHRDVKAENVFFTANAKVVKVGDFGFATRVDKINQHLNTFCGSPPYAAPELFEDDHYVGPAVDVWALGVLLCFMLTACMPFRGDTIPKLKNAIVKGEFDISLDKHELSQACLDIIKGILNRNPRQRMTLNQIRCSKWLEGTPWPVGDISYRALPVRRDDAEEAAELSATEVNVRQKMVSMGIDDHLLNSHRERSVRSQVIGTFRILMHREVVGAATDHDAGSRDQSADVARRATTTSSSPSRSWRPSGPPSPSSSSERPTTSGDKRQKKKATKKTSKLCNIL